MKKNRMLLFHLLIMPLCLLLSTHCTGDQKSQKIIAQYTIKPIGKFIIYGLDIGKITDQTFSEIEKELNSKTKIDREVSVAFIGIEKDFVSKSIKTGYKDHIDILYGPIHDPNTYERYKDIVPYSIRFYGELNPNEKPITKNSVLEELKRNLPDDDTTRKALNDIQNILLKGDSKKDSVIRIAFEMPKFPIAEFKIGFSYKGDIFYTYAFSRKNEIYPP
jgi:hypothetical protein